MKSLTVSPIGLETWNAPIHGGNRKQSWAARRGLVLKLGAGTLTGEGEASPLPGYSTESLASVKTALQGLPELRLDLSAPLRSAASLAETHISAELPSARFALECALLELAAAELHRPLWALLAPSARVRPVSEVLTRLEVAERQAIAHRKAGIRTLKLKVGRPEAEEAELATLDALQGVPDTEVRLDANQGWSGCWERWAELLAERPVEMVEEPAPWPELRHVPTRLRIGLDETLREPAIGGEALQHLGTRAVVVLKPAVLGGLSAALAWAERAEKVGGAAVASHLFDGPVAARALRALAVVLPGELAQGLGVQRAGGAWIRPEDQEPK